MKNHYIPRYYLEGFTDPKDNKIWIFEKNGPLKIKTTVPNVGFETNYYTPEVESLLSNKIECPGNIVIEKIRRREILQKDDKEYLARYMDTMLKRVPQGIITMREFAPSVAKDLKLEFESEINKIIEEYPSEADYYNEKRKEIFSLIEKQEENPDKNLWLSVLTAESEKFVHILSQMTWRFLTSDEYPAFITCDNPVYYFKWKGIAKKDSEVTFPISSNVALWGTWRKISEGYFKITGPAIKQINRRTALNATRFVYHRKDEYWIQDFIKKKHSLAYLK